MVRIATGDDWLRMVLILGSVALLAGVAGCIGIGVCAYAGLSYVLKSPELHIVTFEIRKGIGRK